MAVNDRKVAITIAGAKPVVKKSLIVSTRGLTECQEQSDNKLVDNDKEVTMPTYKGKKVATTTASVKLVSKKLLTTLANGALTKDVQDVSMRKVGI